MKKASSTEKKAPTKTPTRKTRKTRAKKPVFDGFDSFVNFDGPLVSIVMPAHNAAEFIDDAIHSVLGQTYENWELLIVDDASDDNTLEVVKQFGDERIRVISCKRNGGAVKARNRGVRVSRGKFLCFLDADDLWQPDKLERQLAFMAKKDCAFSFASYVFADSKGRPNGKVVRVPSVVESSSRQFGKTNAILTSTVMFNMNKMTKADVMMDEGKGKWQRALEKLGQAYGMYSVMASRGHDAKVSFWQKMRRGVR